MKQNKKNLPTDKLKYGINIVNDTSSLPTEADSFGDIKIDCKNKSINVILLEEAKKDIFWKEKLNQYMFGAQKQIDQNPFFAMTKEKFQTGYVLHIKKDVDNTETIDLIIGTTAENSLGYIFVYLEEGARLNIVEHLKTKIYLGLIIDVVVEDNARLNYVINQDTNTHAKNTILRHAVVKESATIAWFDIELGSQMTISSITTNIVGEKSRAYTYGLFSGNNNQVFDLYAATVHNASETYSNMMTKGVLNESAKGIYRGLVRVPEGSYKCEGYQQADTLLLSDKAEIDSVPDLEIANNDVKCSHGVTTTNINKEKLFYLKSRGINEEEAKKLVIQAHISPIIDMLPNEEIKKTVQDTIIVV